MRVWILLLSAGLICLDLTNHLFAGATVGAYYYPWYGPNVGGHTFQDTLRYHLAPDNQPPTLGAYDSRALDVINSHIDQSHLANISMWSMSWWGPNTFEDRAIRNSILVNPRASELSYTIHYESVGRLGSFDNPNYDRLYSDFEYLGENIFSDPNYMQIDGRPVIVMYLSREYFRNQAGWDALNQLRSMMESEFGYDPYIIGDHLFNSLAPGAEHLDAVTGFDVYGQVFSNRPTSITQINKLESIYNVAQFQADSAGVDFIPGISPGYNDKTVRPGNAPATRYVEGPGYGPDAAGSTLREILQRAALPHLDEDVNNLILVNSFNEWHEDTQVEATILSDRTNLDDSTSGTAYTLGKYYEGYGNLYLDILREETTDPLPGDFNNDGLVDGTDFLAWQHNPQLGMLSDWQNAYGGIPILSHSIGIVPEPSSYALILLGIAGPCVRRANTSKSAHR